MNEAGFNTQPGPGLLKNPRKEGLVLKLGPQLYEKQMFIPSLKAAISSKNSR